MKYSVHYVYEVAKANLNLGIMNPDFCKIHEPHKVTSLLILYSYMLHNAYWFSIKIHVTYCHPLSSLTRDAPILPA